MDRHNEEYQTPTYTYTTTNFAEFRAKDANFPDFGLKPRPNSKPTGLC